MTTETAVAAAGLGAGILVIGIRWSVTGAQKAARKKTAQKLQKKLDAARRARKGAKAASGAEIGEFLVESLSDMAAVDYAQDPTVRRLTSEVLTLAREQQEEWLRASPP